MELNAKLTRKLFTNRNGWTVGLFLTQDNSQNPKSFKGVGILQPCMINGVYKLTGNNENTSYGEQFTIQTAILDFSEDDPELLLSFLEDKISKRLARALINKYGKGLQDLLRDGNVSEIEEETSKKLYHDWTLTRVYSEQAQKLTDFGISGTYHTRILDKWGATAAALIKDDPYVLMEVSGIGFKKTDTIARNMGIKFNDPRRLSASMIDVLQKQESYGHTWTNIHDLKNKAYEMTRVTLEDKNLPKDTILNEKEQVFRNFLHQAEQIIVNRMMEFSKKDPVDYSHVNIEELNTEQKQAVDNAANHTVSIITGGPGTGKTYCTKKVVDLFRSRGLAIVCPTGKAALRISELTGVTAKTIHSFLEPEKGSLVRFQRREDNPVDAGIIIIDEFSMVDTWLYGALLRALNQGSRLVLVGDVDQLPSIGPGSLLFDFIESELFPVTKLVDIMRTDKPNITSNTLRIKGGSANFTQGSDFVLIRQSQEDKIRIEIISMMKRDPSYQVLVPMHKTSVGTLGLNKELQDIVNPHGVHIKGTQYREGDKIIITKNEYQLGVMNGELGIVCGVDTARKKLSLRLDSAPDKEREFPLDITDIMQLGYAITIHKAQGSEFNKVIVPLHTSHKIMLNRNLLYTALTRAKEECVLICQSSLLKFAINRKQDPRRTGVFEGLINYIVEEEKLDEKNSLSID